MKFNTCKSFFTVWLLLLFLSVNLAQAANQKQRVKSVSSNEIQQRIQSIKDRQNLSDELKAQILTVYQESEDNLRRARNSKLK
jgi:hypothetical protein